MIKTLFKCSIFISASITLSACGGGSSVASNSSDTDSTQIQNYLKKPTTTPGNKGNGKDTNSNNTESNNTESNDTESNDTESNDTTANEDNSEATDTTYTTPNINDTPYQPTSGYTHLSVNTTNGGKVSGIGIYCGVDCSEYYDKTYNIRLTAVTQPGYQFDGWSGDCNGYDDCQISTDRDRHITATFTLLNSADCL